MQTDTGTTKFMDKIGDAVNTFLVGVGTVAFIWVVAFFIVSFIDK